MKLQTNKRPYNTIGDVHHITMDKFEFEHLRSSIKSTTAMTNFINGISNFKFNAFVDRKFVIIITPDDCEKPDHKMSFLFFGKINPIYVKDFKMRANRSWRIDDIPKSPVVCVYCANTDRFSKIRCSIIISEDMEKKFLVEGPAAVKRNGFREMFDDTSNFCYGSYAQGQLLQSIIDDNNI